MPINAIVLPAGTGVGNICVSRSPARLMAAPVNSESGRTVRMDDCPEIFLAICGAMMPTKPTGPQNAVTAPVVIQHPNMVTIRVRRTLAPDA